MKITRILEQHRQDQGTRSLPQNLGDSFLLKHNRLFKIIRESVLKGGFKLSSDFNPDYQALPYSQLEEILSSRTIPYSDNVSVLKSLKADVEWDEIVDGLKKNYIFHESCHGAARNAALKAKPQNKILQVLLEESFANACELLAVADVHDETHKIFYEINSYSYLFEHRTHFKKAIEDLGLQPLLKFMVLCYLHSNFLRSGIDEKSFLKILKLSSLENLSPQKLKTLKAFSKLAFTLDIRFRTVTTGFHLKLSGLKGDLKSLLDLDFLLLIEKDPTFLNLMLADF